MQERLQKFLASAGVASRRQAEKLMLEGRVTVNGQTVTQLGSKVESQKDAVKVDGKLIRVESLQYVLMNKPKGVICTMDDPEGRPKVTDLLKGVKARLYPVGRLDFDTTGALLLTNDGELANLLMHPKHRFAKTYLAKVKGIPSEVSLEKFRSGLFIDGRRTSPAEVKIATVKEKNSLLQITLREGRNKQVKRMCQAMGHPVIRLHRSAFGFLGVVDIEIGRWRHLEPGEVERLKSAADKDQVKAPVPIASLRPKGLRPAARPFERARRAGRNESKPGRSDAKPGRSDAKPGRSDAKPGRGDAKSGRNERASRNDKPSRRNVRS